MAECWTWVGSVPGYDDLMPKVAVGRGQYNYSLNVVEAGVPSGAAIFATVRCINFAGVATEATSDVIVVDLQGPFIGQIFDVIDTASRVDISY